MSFAELGLTPALVAPLARLGYARPTPVQALAIPVVLRGDDLLARAQTGTGKTAAFGLPMIDRLRAAGTRGAAPRAPRGLVLVPTRELALQVHEALTTYGAPVGLRSTAVFGGVPIRRQMQALARGVDIVVATPGRLIDHLDQRTVDLSRVEVLVLDEADRMLDMGFLPPLRRILRVLPGERQTLLFSATLAQEVARLAGDFTRTPARVDVSDTQTVAPTVAHCAHPVGDGRKSALLLHVLGEAGADRSLVFCRTKRGSNRVGEQLVRAGIAAAVIHGNKSQGARTRALRDFQAGRVRVLVATDLAARGLDIPQLPLVVNFDLPLVAADYVHRVGRTGRAGAAGRAVSLVSAADHGLLRDIERLLPAPVEMVAVDGFAADRALAPAAAGAFPRARTRPNGPGRPAGGRGRRPRNRPAGRPAARRTSGRSRAGR